jgi:hypothetical protein
MFDLEIGPESSPECAPDSYQLDFGDRTSPASGSSSGPSQLFHTYFEAGTYNVVLLYTRQVNVGGSVPNCVSQSGSESMLLTIEEPEPVRFIGSDGDWFNQGNWADGRVPGPTDDVIINESNHVVIDPAKGSGRAIEIRDLHILDSARLETLPGTELIFRESTFDTTGTSSFQSTVLKGQVLHASTCNCEPGIRANPSAFDVEYMNLKGIHVQLFLGGIKPAEADDIGPGHYANFQGQTVMLSETTLAVDLIYDFQPQPGDQFVIVEAEDEIIGQFSNAADGDEVARFDGVALVISYERNQIVLTAEAR